MKIIINISLLLLVFTAKGQMGIFDLEDVNKTLFILESSINNNNLEDIQKITSTSFITSKKIITLFNTFKNRHINLGYTHELLQKEFNIRNTNNKLIVHFEKGDNNFWYIQDAYIRQKGKVDSLKKHGFKPLALEYNFVDFLEAIKDNSIIKYSGLAPNGKLSLEYIRSNPLEQSNTSDLWIKDVIIHDGENIIDICFFKISYFESIQNQKRGWLITDFGSMKDQPTTMLEQMLLGKTNEYNLNKKSKYSFLNIKSEEISNKKEKSSNRKIIINNEYVNVRNAPGTNKTKIIGKALEGQVYNIIKEEKAWINIKFDNTNGWVSSKYVSIINEY